MFNLQPETALPLAGTESEGTPDWGSLAEAEIAPAAWATGRAAGHPVKRCLDVLGAVAGIVLLGPLMLAVAASVRLDSRGPALFRQRRLGLCGRPFTILKFRTMVSDAESRLDELERFNESDGGVLFKMKRDPRITPLGRFLRRTSLDELPQLFNVLAGHMSLVGPRPLQLRDCALLSASDPDGFRARLSVSPGLTGPWQAYARSETGFEQMVRYDLDYIDRWSIWLDLHLIARTVVVVVARKGAY